MKESMSGRCLCGKVKFSAVPASNKMDACHCGQCRKWSGGILFAVPCTEVQVENKHELAVYRSSDRAERLFCKTCGSNLFWQTTDNSINAVIIQAFDDPAQFEFSCEVFIDEKPKNYTFANETQKLTGKEYRAKYSLSEA